MYFETQKNDNIRTKTAHRSESYDCTENEERKV